MANLSQHLIHRYEILPNTAEWQFRDLIELPRDLHKVCKANAAQRFAREDTDVSFCTLFSAGCSHAASIEISPSKRSIKVTVYRLNARFEQQWTVSYAGTQEEFQAVNPLTWYDEDKIHGGITEDGQAVLLVYKASGGPSTAYCVNANGFTRGKPPSDLGSGYSTTEGHYQRTANVYSTPGKQLSQAKASR